MTNYHRPLTTTSLILIKIGVWGYLIAKTVFPLNTKKVQICEIMSGGFAVKIQQCVKQVRWFLVTFSFY